MFVWSNIPNEHTDLVKNYHHHPTGKTKPLQHNFHLYNWKYEEREFLFRCYFGVHIVNNIVSFTCMAKWFSYISTCIYSFSHKRKNFFTIFADYPNYLTESLAWEQTWFTYSAFLLYRQEMVRKWDELTSGP